MKNRAECLKFLKLARYRGLKPETVKGFLDTFVSVDLVLEQIEKRAKDINGSKIIAPDEDTLEIELDLIEKNNCFPVYYGSDLYPSLLKEVFSAPIFFTAKGNSECLSCPHISVVGSRIPMISSVTFVSKIVGDLVDAGFTVVSGLASGIDSVAHRSVLEKKKIGCSTIAVVGNGLGCIYPMENAGLYRDIPEQGGLILSEFEFNAKPLAHHFPRRNLTIASISYGTLVIEARRSSGSLITAKYAHSFNREVYAVPGFPNDERHLGANDLIKNGLAKITSGINDIMEDLGGVVNSFIKELTKGRSFDFNVDVDLVDSLPSSDTVDSVKERVMSAISSSPVSLEQMSFALDINQRVLTIALLELEIGDCIERTFDGSFVKNS